MHNIDIYFVNVFHFLDWSAAEFVGNSQRGVHILEGAVSWLPVAHLELEVGILSLAQQPISFTALL